MSSKGAVAEVRPVGLLDRAGVDLPALLDIAEQALRRAGTVPLDGAVADEVLTQTVQRLEALARMCQGHKLTIVAEIAEREAHRGQAARTTEDLLAQTLNLSRGEAKAQAELAAGLTGLPETAAALKDGRIGVGQASVTVRKAGELDGRDDADALRAQLDGYAAQQGQTVDKARLGRGIDALVHEAAPDVLADREQAAHRRRGVWFGERDGLPSLQAILPVEAMAAVRAAVEALGKPDGANDPRTPAQRHADALTAIARRYLDEGGLPQVATQQPHVLLLTTPDALHNHDSAQPSLLDGHGPVSGATARQICCDADITPVVTDRNGAILDIGRAQRSPTRPQRAAVIARDKACIGCGAPVTRCEIHHITWWRDKGATDLDNLALVCWNCHRHIHHHGWTITRDHTGRYHTSPPTTSPQHPDNNIETEPPPLAHTG